MLFSYINALLIKNSDTCKRYLGMTAAMTQVPQ